MKNNNWIADFVANSMDQALKSEEYKTLFGTQYKTAGEKCAKCHKDMEDCMCDSSMADDNDARSGKKCSKCHEPMKDCECDSSKADDNAAKKKEKDSKDSMKADDQDAKKSKDSKDSSKADDNNGSDGKDPQTGATVSNQGSKIEFPADKITGKPQKADAHSANTLDSTSKNPYPSKQYDADEYRNADVLRADDGSDEEKVSSAYNVAIDSLLIASAALDRVGLGQGSAISLKLASLVVEAKKKEKDSKKSSKDSKKSDSKKDSKKDSNSAKDKKSDSKKSDSKDSKKDSKDSKKSSKK